MNATETKKKITLATIKSFIRKSNKSLHILCKSRFDGMTDCVESTGTKEFSPALISDSPGSHDLGIHGAWFVGSSRDYFSAFDDGVLTGYVISNCCGSFTLAIKKSKLTTEETADPMDDFNYVGSPMHY